MSCPSKYQLKNWHIDGEPKVIHCIQVGKHSRHKCDGYTWLTADEYKEEKFMDVIYTPMSIDGESGYFLSDDEYQKLYQAATGQDMTEYTQSLENEVANLRSAIDDAYATVSTLRYNLGNA